MPKFSLELLFQIIGIGSASGLVSKDHSLFIIGDNSGFLYEYNLETTLLKRHPLLANSSENIPKKEKPDFEAITLFENHFYILGSGSTENRNQMVTINAIDKATIATTDLGDLYGVMQRFGKIKPEDFNIEGAIYNGNRWYLFNRGNVSSNKNTLFTIEGKNLTDELSMLSNEYQLPKINGVRASFTDAQLVDTKIYFLATAENTASTYHDGEVLGSLIGCIDSKTMKIEFTQKISDTHKFEGLTLFKNTAENITFLLCEDKDTEELKSDIYQMTLTK